MKRESHYNLSGDDVYFTAYSLLVISNNSCCKLHYQKGLNLILLSYVRALANLLLVHGNDAARARQALLHRKAQARVHLRL
jgi:hypothetical protein